MNRRISIAFLATLVVAVLPAAASAHVTVQPSEAPAGAFKRLDVRVPNEKDDASTKKVEVQFPEGFIFVSYEPVPGWKTTVTKAKLDKPVEAFGDEYTEGVAKVTFTATGDGIAPGQFQDFGLSVGLPDKPGTALTFKSLQTYSDGEVVRWIGAADSELPAPQVTLTAAEAEHGAAHKPAAEANDSGSNDHGDMLAVIALIVGGLGLVAGVAGLVIARR